MKSFSEIFNWQFELLLIYILNYVRWFRMVGVDWKSFVLVIFIIVGQVFGQTSDIVGKMTIGYQGWFTTPSDGSPRRSWVHWTISSGPTGTTPPSPGNCKFEVYPDMREYTQRYQTGLASLGNGQPANLFSSWDQSSVNLHFNWMRTYGIETVSFQVCNNKQQFGSINNCHFIRNCSIPSEKSIIL